MPLEIKRSCTCAGEEMCHTQHECALLDASVSWRVGISVLVCWLVVDLCACMFVGAVLHLTQIITICHEESQNVDMFRLDSIDNVCARVHVRVHLHVVSS